MAASQTKEGEVAGAGAQLFPPETLAAQLHTIELVLAMYCGDGELLVSPQTSDHIRALADYLALPLSDLGSAQSHSLKASLPASISLTLVIRPDPNAEADADDPTSPHSVLLLNRDRTRNLHLEVSLPLRRKAGTAAHDAEEEPVLHLRSPDWLSRAQYDALCAQAKIGQAILEGQRGTEDEEEGQEADGAAIIMAAIERVSEAALDFVSSPSSSSLPGAIDTQSHQAGGNVALSTLVLRTWHYLPSLSTKLKRADLVSYAQSHVPPLTGFVLAGKPGLVVLEYPLPASSTSVDDNSTSSANANVNANAEQERALAHALRTGSSSLDTYWSRIKSRSWADIPSSHKKVSERLREPRAQRAFESMQEITRAQELGGQEAMGGARGNRNEMGRVEGWLESRGVGGRLEAVLGADWGGAERE